MNDRQLLDLIHRTPWIDDALTSFDFDIARVENGPVEPVKFPGDARFEMIAGDASGGAFVFIGDHDVHPVVYIGSEGEGGLIAHGLRDTLALVVGLSSLHDATVVPIDEDQDRLITWLAEADAEIRSDQPDLDERRAQLTQALELPDAYDVLPAFHTAARDNTYRPWHATENIPYRPMLDPDLWDA
ncbi:hypothetical protein KIH74_35135 [Kineosporia sp. J2-2]|uniref:SUKH-4 immunity protein of toxin-antitoxin system n=1 Tax=Kineosporia corallincola TaxID=2835133 RepID=A0ABS5TTW1_9ACTN|nr:hypothetical protein [Kineosporia corallincola]MBT0774231.1 hypothetical protein [Kineosporia corallincola]